MTYDPNDWPDDAPESGQGRRMMLTFGAESAAKIRALAYRMDCPTREVARRALTLLSLWASLGEGEEMMVKRRDKSLDRVVGWTLKPEREPDE